MSGDSTAAPAPHLFGAVAFGACAAGLVDVVAANITESFANPRVRVFHGLYDVALTMCLGLVVDLLLRATSLLAAKNRWLARIVLAAVAAATAYGLLERNFARQSSLLFDGVLYGPFIGLLVVASGVGAVVVHALSGWLSKRLWGRIVGVVVGLAVAIANVRLFRDDYQEAHTGVVVLCSLLLGVTAADFFRGRELAAPLVWSRRVLLSAAVVFGVVQPDNAVRLALFESPGSAGAWAFAQHYWTLPGMRGAPHPDIDPRWLVLREGAPAVEPSPERLAGDKPVVVLLTIDAVRADVMFDDSKNKDWPAFSRLLREGAVFTQARSPGSQTSVSLTALFSGKYFSETYWERFGDGKNRFEYAAAERSPRFTELLDKAGVLTFKVVSLMFLQNSYGVAPGFASEEMVTEGRRHARGAEVIEPILARLRSAGPEPLFIFSHLTEPHAPYDRGKVRFGPRFDCYVSEIEAADQFVGQVMRALDTPALRDRAILIVSSDHGEAFGEHGTYQHTKTIYEEMVRVPLLIWGAGVKPQRIAQPVSLIDLNPTIVDIFGITRPDTITAESLVPLLAGREVRLTRPILGEGRLRRSLYLGDLKIIVDLRRQTIELFDLAADPKELHNIYEEKPELARPLLATLAAFFETRGFHERGYEPLYKP